MTTDLNTCHLIPTAQADVLRGGTALTDAALRTSIKAGSARIVANPYTRLVRSVLRRALGGEA